MTDVASWSPPALPRSAWWFAAACLAAQVVSLADRGVSAAEPVWVVVSMLLTALVVGWVAAGVLRARTGRLVLVWVLLGLELLLLLADVLLRALDPARDVPGLDALRLVLVAAQVTALAWFCRSAYVGWQRAHRDHPGASIRRLVLVAVVVGALGGLTAAGDGNTASVQLRVGL